jgi:hypothetical protein
MSFAVVKPLLIVMVVITGTGLMAVISWPQQRSSDSADVPLLKTPAWQGQMPQYGEQLMIRRENQNTQALLFKQTKRETVYRYEAGATTLTPTTEQAWRAANSPIAECGKQSAPAPQAMDIDKRTHRLIAGTKTISTEGRTVMRLAESPSKRFVAVLSATGPPKPSLIPFYGGSTASGEYYHQILSLPDLVSIGSAVRIPLERESDVLIPCWSADEKNIVYHHVFFAYFSVMETKVPQLAKP